MTEQVYREAIFLAFTTGFAVGGLVIAILVLWAFVGGLKMALRESDRAFRDLMAGEEDENWKRGGKNTPEDEKWLRDNLGG